MLGEVRVRALGAVEAMRCVVGARGGRVGGGVVDICCFTVFARVDAVPEIEDEG